MAVTFFAHTDLNQIDIDEFEGGGCDAMNGVATTIIAYGADANPHNAPSRITIAPEYSTAR